MVFEDPSVQVANGDVQRKPAAKKSASSETPSAPAKGCETVAGSAAATAAGKAGTVSTCCCCCFFLSTSSLPVRSQTPYDCRSARDGGLVWCVAHHAATQAGVRQSAIRVDEYLKI